ncbi:MAG: DUF3362 domain-containing protein, partial [Devosia sp.]
TYLVLDVVVNRGLTFVQYVNTRQPAGLVAFSCAGLLALTFRPQLIGAVDRWFLREPLDPAEVLARLERRFRGSESLREISAALGEELTAALHAARVTVLLLAEDAASLVALDGSAPPLPRHSVLRDLLHTTRSEVLVDARSALARLLPDADQDWIAATGAQILSPLVGASGDLLGVVAIGPGTSDLPYTARHVALATAMYHSGRNPLHKVSYKSGKVFSARSLAQRKLHKAFLRYHDEANFDVLREALVAMNRRDLIGDGEHQLVPAASLKVPKRGPAGRPGSAPPRRGKYNPARGGQWS